MIKACINCIHWKKDHIGKFPIYKCYSERRGETDPETGDIICWEAKEKENE